ncbi:MAG: NAD(P)H-quinone oxidoreductase [Cryobacterium sp.]|nr:NAD(P)H-quinone oxidoreductase [Cryobacterium sp.]
MLAVIVDESNPHRDLTVREIPTPAPKPNEVLIKVAAAGVNRADIHQRFGSYPPPKGAPEWLGLECSGTIEAVGDEVTNFEIGDRVSALLSGGGYAELAIANAGQVFRVPDSVDLIAAAGLPEALATVWSNVFLKAGLRKGHTLLVHGGSSGIGTTAIQLARAIGAQVAVTAGTDEKLEACHALGAEILVNYREQEFVSEVLHATKNVGADVILDSIGGPYLNRNIEALARNGTIILISNQSGEIAELNIGRLMAKWGTIYGSTLRARPDSEKNEVFAAIISDVLPLIATGTVRPVIDSTFSFEDAAKAHERMESSEHVGKILLVPDVH